MQFITRFHIKPFTGSAFQEWLKTHHDDLADNAPEGWTYLGTWLTVRHLGRYDGEMRFELEDYAALGSGFGTEVFQRLFVEKYHEFIDFSRGQIEASLMKSPTEVYVMEGT